MKRFWHDRFLRRIANRKRGVLRVFSSNDPLSSNDSLAAISALCAALLRGEKDAADIPLSRRILDVYSRMDREARRLFFEMLANDFDVDRSEIRAATQAFLSTGNQDSLRRLAAVTEPPRQELFRRLNMAPGGTEVLVSMRGDLLELVGGDDGLRAVDADLKHLLSSWFNPGFLRLDRIGWNSPAILLEQLIHHDNVQIITGWRDLRRRLARDRRCFAFSHTVLPGTPLIFLEVALANGLIRDTRALLDENTPPIDPRSADTAIFYSINSTQPGLRGLSFGNFLIKEALEALRAELPKLDTFATFSPLSGFAPTIRAAARDEMAGFTRLHLEALLEDFRRPLMQASGIDDPVDGMLELLDSSAHARQDLLDAPLRRLALAYLSVRRRGRRCMDPVANFHLSNGATLEQINPFADDSPARMKESFGVMVNYRYAPEAMAGNKKKFLIGGGIPMSASLSRALHKLRPAWTSTPAAA